MDDTNDSPEYRDWCEHMAANLAPKIEDSRCVLSFLPDGDLHIDEHVIHLALELGLSLLMDKPMIVVVEPGAKMPAKLASVADALVEGPPVGADFQHRLEAALRRVLPS